MITISSLTREYLFWPLESPNDLTTATAEVAFMTNSVDKPVSTDWKAASLIAYNQPPGNEPWAVRILVGPGSVDAVPLTASVDYQAWVRITDNPEQPVRKVSVISVE